MARPSLSNAKAITAIGEQSSKPSFELAKERIQLAFSGSSSDSTNANQGVDQHISSFFNADIVARGVRWGPPTTSQRLIGFVTEQRWQGHILTVADGKFWARVYDGTSLNNDEIEEVEFEIDEVPDLMRHLVVPGGIFNWDIGFQVEPSGQRIRQSILQFPMIPTFTAHERKLARQRAQQRFKSLGWDIHQHGHPSKSEDPAGF